MPVDTQPVTVTKAAAIVKLWFLCNDLKTQITLGQMNFSLNVSEPLPSTESWASKKKKKKVPSLLLFSNVCDVSTQMGLT